MSDLPRHRRPHRRPHPGAWTMSPPRRRDATRDLLVALGVGAAAALLTFAVIVLAARGVTA